MNETSAEAPSVPAGKRRRKKFFPEGFGARKKRWLKILIMLVVVIAIVAGCVSRLTKTSTPNSAAVIWCPPSPGRGSDGQLFSAPPRCSRRTPTTSPPCSPAISSAAPLKRATL